MAQSRLQRKLAAILSADVVGYSRLMGADEAGTLARLQAVRSDVFDPTVSAHSGRIIKLMGDGALVEFASVVDAVACALEIQRLMKEPSSSGPEDQAIQFRIGVNVGDVIVEGDDIYGDGVNIAARIEALADPGSVYVSRSAAEEVRDKLPARLEPRGERRVKNVTRPVEIFLVTELGDESPPDAAAPGFALFAPWPPENDRDRAPYRGLKPLDAVDAGIFFGRDEPIAEAMDRIRLLSAVGATRLLVILGASGAGKSSFLRAGLLPQLEYDGRRFLPLRVIRPERAALFGENGLLGALEAALPNRGRAEIRAAIREGGPGVRRLLVEIRDAKTRRRQVRGGEIEPAVIVLSIDQAEELFRVEGGDESAALLEIIRFLAHEEQPAVIVIFAIRSDSYDALQHAKPLEGLSQSTAALLPMPREAYNEVIEAPARRFANAGGKLAIEPQLTQRLLQDIDRSGSGDALPLLAFTLEQLFLEYRGTGVLRLANYEEFGGLRGAINAAVERAFGRADADARIPRDRKARDALLRKGFIPWLAGIDPDSKSLRRNIARREDIPEDARPLIDLLVEERLLSTDSHTVKDAGSGAESLAATIEPAHEALLRQWSLLEGWLLQDFGLLAALEGIKRAARDWEANGKTDEWLTHQGLRLAEASALDARPDLAAQLESRDRAYLEGCAAREAAIAAERERARANELARAKAEAERATAQARFSRNMTRGAAGAAAVLALVAGVSVWLGVVAKREAARAEESYRIAREAADGLVIDIAQGLRTVEGMPSTTVKRILETAKGVVDRLGAAEPGDPDLAKSRVAMLRQFAINYMALGDLTTARDYAEAGVAKAREIAEAAPSEASQRLLASALSILGDVQRGQGSLAGGRASYEEAIAIVDKIGLAGPAGAAGQEIKARALNELSNLEATAGDRTKALETAGRSVDVARALVAADPSDASRQVLLADGLERAGNILGGIATAWSMGVKIDAAQPTDQTGLDRPAALSDYEESLKILRAVDARNPTDTDTRMRLQAILMRIGDLNLATKAYPDALQAHKEALAIANELQTRDPSNTDWKRRVQVSYQKLQLVYAGQGDADAALTAAQESAKIAERLFDIDPGNRLWREDLCGRYSGVGASERAKGDRLAASDAFAKAIAVCRETASRYPSDVQSQLQLARTLFNASKGRAADEALPLLQEALAIVEGLDHGGVLPSAYASWVPYIRDKLQALAARDASK